MCRQLFEPLPLQEVSDSCSDANRVCLVCDGDLRRMESKYFKVLELNVALESRWQSAHWNQVWGDPNIIANHVAANFPVK